MPGVHETRQPPGMVLDDFTMCRKPYDNTPEADPESTLSS